MGVLLLLTFREFTILRTHHLGLQITRGLMAAGSASLFVYAIRYVPLTDGIVVTFVAPLLVTITAVLVLHEPVGIRRWTTVALGLVGVLVVIRPGLGVVHPAVFLILLAALLFTLRQILSRVVAETDPIVTTVAYKALVASICLTRPLPFVWQWPTSSAEFVLLISMAILAAVAEIMVIEALNIADAVIVAPVHYTIIICATIYGFVFFDHLPDIWTWAGALIIAVMGAYTLHREWHLKSG